MKKLLTILKITVFAVGSITLLAIFVATAWNVWESIKPASPIDSGPETLYETKFDAYTLTVVATQNSGEREVTLHIDGRSTSPSSIKLEERWGDITDSKIIPLTGGRYGILLFYNTSDCEISSYDIDLFTYGNGIKHVETLTMAEYNQLDSDKNAFFATIPIYSPYVEGFTTWRFTIPVSIQLGREVVVTPLLTPDGIALIRKAATKDRQLIVDKLGRDEKKDDLKTYLDAEQELHKALTPRRITF